MPSQFFPNRAWLQDVREDNILKWSGHYLRGRGEVAVEMQTVWGTTGFASKTLLATPAVVKISSESANDTNTSGTGARKVLIEGVNSAGALASETVNLNGQTAVTTTTVWLGINLMTVTDSGANEFNEGVIWAGVGTVTSGIPDTKIDRMAIETNHSTTSTHTFPANTKVWPLSIIVNAGDISRLIHYRIRHYYPAASSIPPQQLLHNETTGGSDGIVPFIFAPGSLGVVLIVVEAETSAVVSNVSVAMDFIVEDIS